MLKDLIIINNNAIMFKIIKDGNIEIMAFIRTGKVKSSSGRIHKYLKIVQKCPSKEEGKTKDNCQSW